MSYVLSQEAIEDLSRIYRYGYFNFGETQADHYFDGLYDSFERISQSPLQFPSAAHVREGYRYSVYLAHTIYFRMIPDVGCEIVRIIGRQEF